MGSPRPLITEISRPFWNALKKGRIEIQRCHACLQWVFYPRKFCLHCGRAALLWTRVSGEATLYTFTLAMQPVSEDFPDNVPYLLAIAELTEGIRMATTLVGVDHERVRIGMPLVPVFDGTSFPDITLLRYRAADVPMDLAHESRSIKKEKQW